MNEENTAGWRFIDPQGTFELEDPDQTNYLYFPLVNEAGLMASITPGLNGDIKTGQKRFLTLPVSAEDLHNSRSGRNFWVYIDGQGPWSVSGNSAAQIAQRFNQKLEHVTLQAGFLWHKVTRTSDQLGISSSVTSFVPPGEDAVELMNVTLTNTGEEAVAITPTAAIPIYARSADHLRDHRHVTSLLQRIATGVYGISVCPALSFDEQGHHPNQVTYSVLGVEGTDAPPTRPPLGFFPTVEDFIGEGGCLEWPEAIVKNRAPISYAGEQMEGFEAMGAVRFNTTLLAPGESKTYIIIIAITPGKPALERLVEKYGSPANFEAHLRRCQSDWQQRAGQLSFHSANPDFDRWLKWVGIQPILRQMFGNSFLPHHDYGRGGRGWRDLWQDCLALLMMNPEPVERLLFQNYAGVRMDGSNATIIGARPGEFQADRNNISRVWMDHGAWPYLATRLYLDQSGDLTFLLKDQAYFKDLRIYRSQKIDSRWSPEQGTQQRTASGEVYQGSILEHILVQHLTAFFNAGPSGCLRLENADWNDGMDMAPNRGESVAFSALYAANLQDLVQLLVDLEKQGIRGVSLAKELLILLDSLSSPLDYDSPPGRQQRLSEYFAACGHHVSGEKVVVDTRDLARDLALKAGWLSEHIRQKEWVRSQDGNGQEGNSQKSYGWFNGYYGEDGSQVEGDHPQGVRMTLTGQVFTLMGGIATPEQAQQAARAARRYLYDPRVGGYRLNTHFNEVCLNLGRAFGFAYGHKENGAMFSHMAVMYAYALYRRGLVREGWETLVEIFNHCRCFQTSRIYPGIPEYINSRGRGMYHYLTGSASWYMLTLLTQVYGVRGVSGDLFIEPKLLKEQFDENGEAGVQTIFANRRLNLMYRNPSRLDWEEYQVLGIEINDHPAPHNPRIPRAILEALPQDQDIEITVHLGRTVKG